MLEGDDVSLSGRVGRGFEGLNVGDRSRVQLTSTSHGTVLLIALWRLFGTPASARCAGRSHDDATGRNDVHTTRRPLTSPTRNSTTATTNRRWMNEPIV
jgi:hypothetical protein